MKKIIKNNKVRLNGVINSEARESGLGHLGFSLVEVLVSVAVFTMLITTALSIFQSVVKNQHNAIAAQSVQESTRFALEMISKELRSAIISNYDCDPLGGTDNKVYNTYSDTNGTNLYFKNKYGICVYYFVDAATGQLKIKRGSGLALAITPDELLVSDFKINIVDDTVGSFHSTQAKVTVRMSAEMLSPTDKHEMELQTTISSRYYE